MATSNVYAAMKLGIPAVGTHAHAYIQSYTGFEDLTSRELDG
jgi:nicotinic acid phosphoribosyltransferase